MTSYPDPKDTSPPPPKPFADQDADSDGELQPINWKPVMLTKNNYDGWRAQLDLVLEDHRVLTVATGQRKNDETKAWRE